MRKLNITYHRIGFTFLLSIILLLVLSSVLAQEPVGVTIFVDEDTLTILIPGNQLVSLQGFGFEVVIGNERLTTSLEKYPSFSTLYFNAIPSPICFRLQRANSRQPLPLECNNAPLLIQSLSGADIFWYDSATNQRRTLLIVQSGITQGICPSGQVRCAAKFTPPTFTPTLRPSRTPIPSATSRTTLVITQTLTSIISTNNSMSSAKITNERQNVRSGPGGNFEVIGQLRKNDIAPIIGQNNDSTWLLIQLPDGNEGWVAAYLLDVIGDLDNIAIVNANSQIAPSATYQEFVTTLSSDSSVPTAQITNERQNVRSGPSLNFEVIGQLRKNDIAPIIGQNNDSTWLLIQLPDGNEGWVAAYLLDVIGDISGLPRVSPSMNTGQEPYTSTPTIPPTRQPSTATATSPPTARG